MAPVSIVQVWTFQSDSNPARTYETLQYINGSTSCNCMGWTRRVGPGGVRSCKHTRLVDQDLADSQCLSTKKYGNLDPVMSPFDEIASGKVMTEKPPRKKKLKKFLPESHTQKEEQVFETSNETGRLRRKVIW